MDFRSHKMPKGGYAAIGVFRKHLSENSIKTKYPTIVRTAEEIEEDAKKPEAMEVSEEPV